MPPQPAPRPGATARPGAAHPPTNPTIHPDSAAASGAAGGEAAAYPHGAAGAAGSSGASGSTGNGPLYAPVGNIEPGEVWQLAFWAVTTPIDEDEAAQRRAAVRSILLRLVDDIAWEDEASGAAARKSSHRR